MRLPAFWAAAFEKGFRIGQTEVTVGAFKRFARTTGEKLPPEPSFRGGRSLNPGWSRDGLPIAQVTWDEAKRYCVGRRATPHRRRMGVRRARRGHGPELRRHRAHFLERGEQRPAVGLREGPEGAGGR